MEISEKAYQPFISFFDDEAEISLRLEGVRCVNCLNAIDRALSKLNGIKDTHLNLTQKTATIRWNSKQASLEAILNTIKKTGFGFSPLKSGLAEEEDEARYKNDLKKLMVALFLTMNLMLIAISLWAGFFSGMEKRFEQLFHWLSFVLTTPVIFYSGTDFLKGAVRAVKNGCLNMDFQIAFNAILIYAYSLYNSLQGNQHVYFESAAMFVTFILISKTLESSAINKMKTSLRSLNIRIPQFGRLLTGGKPAELISLDEIKKGDLLELLPGDAVPVDGNVMDGEAEINEASLTGEYLPVCKTVGEMLYSGTFVISGRLKYQTKKTSQRSTLNLLGELLDKALTEKPHLSEKAGFFYRHFTNLIAILSISAFVFRYVSTDSFDEALLNAVAVFIIACPCALALATPLSYLSGFRLASKFRVIMKSTSNFEKIRHITDVVFDKTGTLTIGKPKVVDSLADINIQDTSILTHLLSFSRHPIATCIGHYLDKFPEIEKAESISDINHSTKLGLSGKENHADLIEGFREFSGKGLIATYESGKLVIGNERFIKEHGMQFSGKFLDFAGKHHGKSVVFFAMANRVVAVFAIEDEIRSEAANICDSLKLAGITPHICSGDRLSSVNEVAAKIGINPELIKAEMLPTDKCDYIKYLQSKGYKVLFVGDGLNDSLAMAIADLSISMNSGIDLAIENADIILLENNLKPLTYLRNLSNKVIKLVKTNLTISVCYNILAIPLALAGFVNPPIAALSMSLSSLLVMGNSLRFVNVDIRRKV